jgi:hypothetical protein
LLETDTAKCVPAVVGVALAGLMVQVGGPLVPQLSATLLPYPLIEVSTPLNCPKEFTDVVSEGLAMLRL